MSFTRVHKYDRLYLVLRSYVRQLAAYNNECSRYQSQLDWVLYVRVEIRLSVARHFNSHGNLQSNKKNLSGSLMRWSMVLMVNNWILRQFEAQERLSICNNSYVCIKNVHACMYVQFRTYQLSYLLVCSVKYCKWMMKHFVLRLISFQSKLLVASFIISKNVFKFYCNTWLQRVQKKKTHLQSTCDTNIYIYSYIPLLTYNTEMQVILL